MSDEVIDQTELELPVAAVEIDEQAETAAASDAATPESDEQKRQGGVQRRIDKLTREKHEAIGQNKELRERLTAIEQRLSEKTPAAAAQAEANDPKPVWTGEGDYATFNENLSRWAARQEHRTLKEKEQKDQQQADERERDSAILSNYSEGVKEFVADHDDFDEVVSKIRIAEDVARGVQIAVMEDDNGPALAYYLGQHPEVCQQLSELTPAKALTRLGRISAQLFPDPEIDAEDSPTTPAVRSAPAPIRPVKKVAPTATGLSDDLPKDEWLRRREAQIRKRNG